MQVVGWRWTEKSKRMLYARGVYVEGCLQTAEPGLRWDWLSADNLAVALPTLNLPDQAQASSGQEQSVAGSTACTED